MLNSIPFDSAEKAYFQDVMLDVRPDPLYDSRHRRV
jgi:hypothetical protein